MCGSEVFGINEVVEIFFVRAYFEIKQEISVVITLLDKTVAS